MGALNRIEGILTAMVTPFDADLRVSEASTARLVEHLLANGSDGIVVAGTTGEAPTLSDDEQIALIGHVVELVAGRATVIAGAGSNDTRHACRLTERACALGVDAILSVTPYYNRPNRAGVIRHFEAVADAADCPVILYNIPTRTGINMPPDLLAELAQIDRIAGVKQANADEVMLIDGLALYAGNDDLLRSVLDLGGAGGILVASHIVGPQMRRMVDEPDVRAEIDRSLGDVYGALSVTANPIPIKAALNELGFEVGGLRLPLVEASADELEAVRAMLAAHEMIATSVR